MIHLGDITKLHGYDIPPVDCITGGSPCQDLSLAGKRAGLAGERSGLFMEQVRLVKEMRDATRGNAALYRGGIKPKYTVWENVYGAMSSNGGKDFQAVLTEIARIVCKDCPDVPLPEKGRWAKSGCLMGYGDDGQPFSIAYRLHDAQFWGVPQRRKRISLVADFGGLSAPEVLFVRKGLSGDTEESRSEGEGAARDSEESIGKAISFQERAGRPGGGKGILIQEDKVCSIRTQQNQSVCYGIGGYNSEGMKSDNPHSGIYEADTSRTLDLNGGNPGCNQGGMAVVALENHPNDSRIKISADGIVQTLSGRMGTGGNNTPMVMQEPYCIGNGQVDQTRLSDKVGTLNCMHDQQAVMTWGIDRTAYNQGQNAQFKPQFDEEKSASLIAKGPNAVATHTVRRLTPMECERLQGFPDGWTDIGEWTDSKGKVHDSSDSARYKALGNSIALPFWFYLLRRISAQYERPATLGSLFDGIGGFPLCWERCNGKGTAIWASEIEEFPIAVTKVRFPE